MEHLIHFSYLTNTFSVDIYYQFNEVNSTISTVWLSSLHIIILVFVMWHYLILRIKYFVLPFDADCLNYTYNGTTIYACGTTCVGCKCNALFEY